MTEQELFAYEFRKKQEEDELRRAGLDPSGSPVLPEYEHVDPGFVTPGTFSGFDPLPPGFIPDDELV